MRVGQRAAIDGGGERAAVIPLKGVTHHASEVGNNERERRWLDFKAAAAELRQGGAEGGPATPQTASFAGARALLESHNERSVFDDAAARYADRPLDATTIARAEAVWGELQQALDAGQHERVLALLEGASPEVLREIDAYSWRDRVSPLRDVIKDELPKRSRKPALLALDASLGDPREREGLGQIVEKFLRLNLQDDVSESELVTRYAPTENNALELLVDGHRAFPHILQAIREAQETVNIAYFILADDDIGRQLVGELCAARARGVEVRVTLDGFGSQLANALSGGRALVRKLRRAGIEVHCNHVVDPTRRRELLNHPDHRKLVLCDGKVGFTGGMNVADRYVDEYHDLVVRVEGDAVKQMQADFLFNWLHTMGPIEGDSDELARKFFPKIEREVGKTRTKVAQSIPGESREILETYLDRIRTAEKSIYIGNPYCTNPLIQDALIEAGKRGVDIHVLLPGENDQPYSHLAARERYPAMLDAGVNIYEFPGFIHGKVLVTDEKFVSIGSANMDDVGLFHIYELNLNVEDEAFAKQCLERIWQVDLPRSKRMRKEDITLLQKIGGKIFNKLHHVI